MDIEAPARTERLPDDYYEQIRRVIHRRIVKRLDFAASVVDLGCGSCELDRLLAQRNGQRVVGVDISDAGFPSSDSLEHHVGCLKADARSLGFLPDGSVDAALSSHALHEMVRPVEVLKEAYRILCDGGLIVIVDFPRDSLAQRLWNENYYTQTEIAGMMRSAGFAEAVSFPIARGQLVWAEARKKPRT